MATIEVRIKNGEAHIDVLGVTDASCAELTRHLESALGTVEECQRKPEYYVELDGIKQYVQEDE
jgi:hypothetical protein